MTYKDCFICNIPGVNYGSKPVYNKYTSEDPSGKSYGIKRYYNFLKCPNCELFWVADPDEKYEDMYKSGDYWTKYMESKEWPILEKRLEHDIKFSTWRMNEVINKYGKGGSVLEIGCSSGTLLKLLKEKGYIIKGIELDPQAAGIATAWANCEILAGDIKDLNIEDKFDMVIAIDVLEHLLYPDKDLKIWADLVKDDGLLYIELPDSGCEHALNHGINWDDYVIPTEHVYYFRREHLRKILSHLGFVILEFSNPWTTDRLRCVARKV